MGTEATKWNSAKIQEAEANLRIAEALLRHLRANAARITTRCIHVMKVAEGWTATTAAGAKAAVSQSAISTCGLIMSTQHNTTSANKNY